MQGSNAPDNHAPGVEAATQAAVCCAPPSPLSRAAEAGPAAEHARSAGRAKTAGSAGRHVIEQVAIPAGAFSMGEDRGEGHPADGESPVHRVELAGFAIDATSVTNADFAGFVADTGYATEAETFGYSAVFHLALRASAGDVIGPAAGAPWWLGVRGADWAHPGGRNSGLSGLDDHPVVHVSWNDAVAYCRWAGRRLPTEAEWELASRGGLESARFPWGDTPPDGPDGWRANIWQGDFPRRNTADDGWPTTAPVRTYPPNAFGLWQTVGNVWEWCADWFDAAYYGRSPAHNPPGPAEGTAKVLRGGSYLCHDSYCNRYRNSARSSNTPDSSMANAGFRTVGVTSA
jgi:formylglycine-generating enzyme required for sulfatase activity